MADSIPDNPNASVVPSAGNFRPSTTKSGGNNVGASTPKPTVTIHGLRGGQTTISAQGVISSSHGSSAGKP